MINRSKILGGVLRSSKFVTLASLITGKSQKEIRSIQNRLFKPFGFKHFELAIASAGAFKELKVVQVGANDGKTGDPVFAAIHAYAKAALLIEPQQWLMDSLRSNYSSFRGNLTIENIAIGTEEGTLKLHVLDELYWADYTKNAGSHPSLIFGPCREQVVNRVAGRLGLSKNEADAVVIPDFVPVQPLKTVLEKHGFLDLDVLQVDCEGWDFKVLQSLDDVRPPIINFESANLTDRDWQSFVEWSIENDYGFIRCGMDTLAIRNFPTRELD